MATTDEPIIVEFLSTCGLTNGALKTFADEKNIIAHALGIVEIPCKILDQMINVYMSFVDSYSVPEINNCTCGSNGTLPGGLASCSILQYSFEKQNIKGFANYDDFFYSYIRPRMDSHIKVCAINANGSVYVYYTDTPRVVRYHTSQKGRAYTIIAETYPYLRDIDNAPDKGPIIMIKTSRDPWKIKKEYDQEISQLRSEPQRFIERALGAPTRMNISQQIEIFHKYFNECPQMNMQEYLLQYRPTDVIYIQ